MYDPAVTFWKVTNPVAFVTSNSILLPEGWTTAETLVSPSGLSLRSLTHNCMVTPLFMAVVGAGVGAGVSVAVGLGLGVGLGVGVGEEVGEGEVVGVGVTVGLEDGAGVGLATGVAVGAGVGVGVGVIVICAIPKPSNHPDFEAFTIMSQMVICEMFGLVKVVL